MTDCGGRRGRRRGTRFTMSICDSVITTDSEVATEKQELPPVGYESA